MLGAKAEIANLDNKNKLEKNNQLEQTHSCEKSNVDDAKRITNCKSKPRLLGEHILAKFTMYTQAVASMSNVRAEVRATGLKKHLTPGFVNPSCSAREKP